MNSRENKLADTHAIDDHRSTSVLEADLGMPAMDACGTHTGSKQGEKALSIDSLQDLILELQAAPSAENADLLLVADLIVRFFKRPAHQITIEAIRRNKRYLMLLFSYLQIPLESIDHFVGLAGALVAKAYRLVEEDCAATETNAARSTLEKCSEQVLNAMPPQTADPRPVLY
jgi:hypothetical protein